MAKCILKIPAIRGQVIVESDESDSSEYTASASGFEPFVFAAESLGMAVDTVCRQIGQFQRTPEFKAKQAIASQRRKESINKAFGKV